MRCSTLYPPNLEAMSEDIIGDVHQRVGPLRHHVVSRMAKNEICVQQHYSSEILVENHANQAKVSYSVHLALNKQGYISEKSSCREYQKKRQQRYRMRQRKHINDLENDSQQLQEETEHLQAQLASHRTAKVPLTVWSVAIEYFRIFEHGLQRKLLQPRLIS